MLENSFVFHAFDTDWYMAGTLFLAAASSMLVGGSALAYLLVRAGKSRRLTQGELSTMGRTPDPHEVRMYMPGAVGTRVEVSANIDTLRKAAKRGDWGMFFAWPIFMVSWGGGFNFGLLALACHIPEDAGLFYAIIGLFTFPVFVCIPLFMSWAALYTNIDLGVDDPEPAAPTPAPEADASPQEALGGSPGPRA